MTSFKDHFSGHSAEYTRYRPYYPRALFAWLEAQVGRRARAWDCATGNGQAAQGLAEFFAEVVATDASSEQIAAAVPQPRIRYAVAPAERSGFAARSVDLITVGQALHWFDLDAFYGEVRRILKPDGVLAVWCYGLMHVDGAVNAVVRRLYADVVGPYWPPERRHVEQGYQTLPFPFREIAVPPFTMQTEWDLNRILGYLGTLSAGEQGRLQSGSRPAAPVAS